MARQRERDSRVAERKIIRRAVVREKTGYSDTTIWRLERKGLFPLRLLLTEGGAVGWYQDEVDLWVQTRVRHSGKPVRKIAPGCRDGRA